MSEIKSLIDDDIKENIDHSVICVKFAMMSKQIENKDKEIERLNNKIEDLEVLVELLYHEVILNDEQQKLLNSIIIGGDKE